MAQTISISITKLFSLKNTLNIFMALLEFIRANLMECQKKISKM